MHEAGHPSSRPPRRGTWETTNRMARKRRPPGRPVLADNYPPSAHNRFIVSFTTSARCCECSQGRS
jgi:hypothetical protein